METLKKTRQSNFELLRMLSMMMIVGLHYWGYSGISAQAPKSNFITYEIIHSLFVCSVDIFVLITGFFSVNSKKIKVNKIADLVIQVAFWGTVGYLLLCAFTQNHPFVIKDYIKSVFPYITNLHWFVKAYLILLLFIPFFNIIINKITKKNYIVLLVILGLLFSLWPSFAPYAPVDDFGFGFVNLSFMYFIGAFLRKHLSKTPSKTVCVAALIISVALTFLSRRLGWEYATAYNYPSVIISAVSLFLLFKHFNFSSRVVNLLSSVSFGVFLVHSQMYLKDLVYGRLFHAKEVIFGNTGLMLLSFFGSIIVFYAFGFVLEIVRQKVFAITVDKLLIKIPVYKNNIEIGK